MSDPFALPPVKNESMQLLYNYAFEEELEGSREMRARQHEFPFTYDPECDGVIQKVNGVDLEIEWAMDGGDVLEFWRYLETHFLLGAVQSATEDMTPFDGLGIWDKKHSRPRAGKISGRMIIEVSNLASQYSVSLKAMRQHKFFNTPGISPAQLHFMSKAYLINHKLFLKRLVPEAVANARDKMHHKWVTPGVWSKEEAFKAETVFAYWNSMLPYTPDIPEGVSVHAGIDCSTCPGHTLGFHAPGREHATSWWKKNHLKTMLVDSFEKSDREKILLRKKGYLGGGDGLASQQEPESMPRTRAEKKAAKKAQRKIEKKHHQREASLRSELNIGSVHPWLNSLSEDAEPDREDGTSIVNFSPASAASIQSGCPWMIDSSGPFKGQYMTQFSDSENEDGGPILPRLDEEPEPGTCMSDSEDGDFKLGNRADTTGSASSMFVMPTSMAEVEREFSMMGLHSTANSSTSPPQHLQQDLPEPEPDCEPDATAKAMAKAPAQAKAKAKRKQNRRR